MHFFLLSLLSLLVLFVSLFIYFLSHKGNSRLPPGRLGWPVLGENLKLASSGLENFIQERMKKYSEEVFITSFLGEKMAVFCGAAGNKFLFSNENDLLTTWWPASLVKPFSFPSAGDNSLKEVTAKNRRFFEEILKPEALKHFIPIMDSMARDQLQTDWAPFEEVKVYPLSRKYTFSLACRLFLGVEDDNLVKRLSDSFNVAVSGMFTMPIDFPGTAYNRGMKGGKLVKDEFLKIIRERKIELLEKRNVGAEGVDMLSRLLLQTDENDRFVNEIVIANSLVGFLVASYDTTSAAATFVLNYLAELPNIYNKVYKEMMEIAKSKGPQELLNWNDVRKMKYSWDVACEALRLTPPAQGAFREAIKDFTYAGFTIPKGWKTFWSVYSTHKNPKYFPEPEKFDPSRFEGSGPAPYTFVPFGGGSRMCPGREYARMEILVLMYNVVTRFKLEKLIPNEKVIYHASPVPQDGLPVRLLLNYGATSSSNCSIVCNSLASGLS